jgi:hypothetical protein
VTRRVPRLRSRPSFFHPSTEEVGRRTLPEPPGYEPDYAGLSESWRR